VLLRLRLAFTIFKNLQFTTLSKPNTKLEMSDFLSELEHELTCEAEPLHSRISSVLAITSQQQATASSQSQPSPSSTNNSQGTPKKNSGCPKWKNGIDDFPHATVGRYIT
jgi:hypothetical protein